MLKKSRSRLLWIRIACFAILMNALAPSISHAVAYANGQPSAWDVCRADSKAPLKSGAPAKPGAPSKISMTDCDYCVSHAGSFGLPPSFESTLGRFGAQPSHPFLFYRSPAPLAAWSAARPRGPPAFV